MTSAKIMNILTLTAIGIAGLSVFFMIMDWFGYWGRGEYEFAFSIFAGLMLLFLIDILIAALCWRIHQLELTVYKLKQNRIELDHKTERQHPSIIEHIDETGLSEKQTHNDILVTPIHPTKNYVLSIHKEKVYRGNEELRLAPKEFTLIKLLMEHRGLCSTEDIIANVWLEEASNMDRSTQDLNQLIRRLRKKITIAGHDYIGNHPGRGYEFIQWSE